MADRPRFRDILLDELVKRAKPPERDLPQPARAIDWGTAVMHSDPKTPTNLKEVLGGFMKTDKGFPYRDLVGLVKGKK